MKVVIDDKIPFIKGALEDFAKVVYLPGAKTTAADVADASALITRTRTDCSERILGGSNVKFIASATIGYDHIDTAYCDSHKIFWTNAPGCNSSSVAQYITSAILNLAVRNNLRLDTMTLGVIGVGNVGSKVAKVGEALGMKVLLNDPPRARKEGGEKFSSLGEILSEADVVTCHVPLSNEGDDATFHLADASFFRSLKKKPYFINSSRGEVNDTRALIDALKAGKIAGAVVDVWENEPDINKELLSLVDIATPHIAGYSTDGKANGTSMSIQALAKFFGIRELETWYPALVPLPENTFIETDPAGKSFEEAMLEIVSVSYNVMDDFRRLRNSPETFEKQRGDYPLRREFPAYTVRNTANLPEKIVDALKKLSFKMG
ncbi:MAG: 4-phosphoerythronate dehydrogenase PdxB, partial [Candidatus Izemoplasmatales bacterium]|nr:4-phosphoerythronate dehydrogenase PdxB [Candidatus Izemoplasmatales bacterium]